jgi:predicted PurR-regulated permease PerM
MAFARSNESSRVLPLLALALTVLVLFFARDLLILFAFALILAFLLAPAVNRLEAARIPRVVAVAIAGFLAFSVICGIGYVVARQLFNVTRDLPTYRVAIQQRLASFHSPAEQSIEKAFNAIQDFGGDLAISAANANHGMQPISQPQPVRIVDPARSQLQYAAELLMSVVRPIGALGVVLVFTIYLLMEREDLRRRVLLLAGMSRIRLMNQALEDAANRISQYLFSQVTVNAAYGAIFGFGLFLIGVPNATFWGVLAGILRIVPYFGTATGVILPLIVCVGTSTSWRAPLLLIGLFLILELSTTNFVEPLVYRSRTGISSLALLVMAIFWSLLWGWPGLILSTPLTVCIVVLGRNVPQLSFLHALFGADAELSAEGLFYERLLAMDQREARAVVTRFLETKPLVDLYDSVFIPVLALVEQDRHQGVFDHVRSSFFFLCISELVAELAEYREPQTQLKAPRTPGLQMQEDFAVVCISASDQADELTTHMLLQLMERTSHHTLFLPGTVPDEILDSLASEPSNVIFISALPPFAFSQARSLCQRVRAHLPRNRIVIGLWNPGEDLDRSHDHSAERFGNGKPTAVVHSLAQAVRQIDQWHQEAIGVSSPGHRNAVTQPLT